MAAISPVVDPPASPKIEKAKPIWSQQRWLEGIDELPDYLPDHNDLPESDGTFVKNFQEHPQSNLLTNSIIPILKQIHPDEQFAIGQDSGIYWDLKDAIETRSARRAVSPDWYYVPNVPPTLDGQIRRSYVMWQEKISPIIILEFVSGSGAEERDTTPRTGKFWVYEQIVQPQYYGIYEVMKAQVEVYQMVSGQFQKMLPNERNHYPIAPLGVELGIWQGKYDNAELPWLRWWDAEGKLLLTGDERADREAQRAERLIAQMRALGIEPEE